MDIAEGRLSAKAIQEAIDASCVATQKRDLVKLSLVLRRAEKEDLTSELHRLPEGKVDAFYRDGFRTAPPALYHCLVLESGATPKTTLGLVFFHFAYSTWDGRVLYLAGSTLDASGKETKSAIMYTLSDIAASLDCVRFVWPTLDSNHEERKLYDDELKAETLHGCLTLQLNRTQVHMFLSTRQEDQSENEAPPFMGPLTVEAIHQAVDSCLIPSNVALEKTKRRLRRAREEDVESILELVHGLAGYAKEPDAVQVTMDHLRRDGFGNTPMFHCILLEDVRSGELNALPVGMALYFFGFSSKEGGRFLYLEDLFIEKAHRGVGGGKTLMYTLADICRTLDCESFFWQALDWNTPALTFYGSIGAVVLQGHLTVRLVGDQLHGFLKTRHSTLEPDV